MRFCPFCAQELQDDVNRCVFCGKRLPTSNTGPKRKVSAPVPAVKTGFEVAEIERPSGGEPKDPPPVAPPAPPSPTKDTSLSALVAEQQTKPAPPPAPSSLPSLGVRPPATTPPLPLGVRPPATTPQPPLGVRPSATTPQPPLGVRPPATTPPPPAPSDDPPTKVPLPPPPLSVAEVTAPALGQPLGAPPAGPPAAASTDSADVLAPVAEEMAPPIDAADSPALLLAGQLETMPADGPPGFFGGLPYLMTVVKMRRASQHVIRLLENEIQTEELKLQELCRDLGKRARKIDHEHPASQAAMAALLGLEQERSAAEAQQAAVDSQLHDQQKSHAQIEADCRSRIDTENGHVSRLQKEVADKTGGIRQQSTDVGQQDKRIKSLIKERDDRLAQVNKTQDPAQQEVQQRAIADLGMQIADGERLRQETTGQIQTAGPPLEQAKLALAEAQSRLSEAQTQLTAAKQELNTMQQAASADQKQRALAIGQIDRSIGDQLLALGRAIDESRAAEPAFDEFYAQIDILGKGISIRRERSDLLKADRENYDPKPYKNGMILCFSLGGLLLISIVSLLILIL